MGALDWIAIALGLLYAGLLYVVFTFEPRASKPTRDPLWGADVEASVEAIKYMYTVEEPGLSTAQELDAALQLVLFDEWRGPLSTLKQRVHERLHCD